MNPLSYASSSRSALLRLRCEAERQQLLAQLSDIESRLQHADERLQAARRFFTRPAVIAGGVALMFALRRIGNKWKWLSRGLMAATTARRLFQAFKNR